MPYSVFEVFRLHEHDEERDLNIGWYFRDPVGGYQGPYITYNDAYAACDTYKTMVTFNQKFFKRMEI